MKAIEYITVILSSIGGSLVIFFALSKWLGDLWLKRIIEREKEVLAEKHTAFSHQLEINRSRLSTYDQAQFHLYNELWESLADLASAADNLWDKASPKNLNRMKGQLTATQAMVRRKSLLIEDSHKRALDEALFGLGSGHDK